MSVEMAWDDFRQLTPIQVMGLLLLRDAFSLELFYQIYKEKPSLAQSQQVTAEKILKKE